MKIITFRKEFKELILNGKKTETRRINKYVKVGDILLAKVGRLGRGFAELEVIEFRREKLWDIRFIDIINEGFNWNFEKPDMASGLKWFSFIWNLINKKSGIRWENNPTVSVIQFKLIKKR